MTAAPPANRPQRAPPFSSTQVVRRCWKCKEPKPVSSGMALFELGAGHTRSSFVCLDCARRHVALHAGKL